MDRIRKAFKNIPVKLLIWLASLFLSTPRPRTKLRICQSGESPGTRKHRTHNIKQFMIGNG